jgi:hypothetical protein
MRQRIFKLGSYSSCVISDTTKHILQFFVSFAGYEASKDRIVVNVEFEVSEVTCRILL